MKKTCIYCSKKFDYDIIDICPECIEIKNKNINKVSLPEKDLKRLLSDVEKYIIQAMTGHTCGQECGGDPKWFSSSTCKGCFPDTTQHYRHTAEMIISWISELWKEKIMKDWLIGKGDNDETL